MKRIILIIAILYDSCGIYSYQLSVVRYAETKEMILMNRLRDVIVIIVNPLSQIYRLVRVHQDYYD